MKEILKHGLGPAQPAPCPLPSQPPSHCSPHCPAFRPLCSLCCLLWQDLCPCFLLPGLLFFPSWKVNDCPSPAAEVLFRDLLGTIAWETASQIALKNCSKEVGGEASLHVNILVREYKQSVYILVKDYCQSQRAVFSS